MLIWPESKLPDVGEIRRRSKFPDRVFVPPTRTVIASEFVPTVPEMTHVELVGVNLRKVNTPLRALVAPETRTMNPFVLVATPAPSLTPDELEL